MPTAELLTHTDLDGAGCAVLFAAVHPTAGRYSLVENGAIDDRVREAAARLDPTSGDELLITDHGIEPATADLVDAYCGAGGRASLLDHHRSSAHLTGRLWATIDESRSATGLLFDHLGKPPAYAEFAGLVEDHDMWRHQDPRSERLAALAGLLGHDRFLARFIANPAPDFTEGERMLLENAEARRADYLNRKAGQARKVAIGGVEWAVCYAEDYQSDLAERLMKELGVSATAIVNAGKRTVSLRGRDFDVSGIAESFGGGGHARAAAFTFRGSALEVELQRFEAALDAALENRPPPARGSVQP